MTGTTCSVSSSVTHPDLRIQVLKVLNDGSGADIQFSSNLGIGHSHGNASQNLGLPSGYPQDRLKNFDVIPPFSTTVRDSGARVPTLASPSAGADRARAVAPARFVTPSFGYRCSRCL